MARTIPLLTFVEKVEPIVRLCHTVIEKHGGQRRGFDIAHPGVYRGGYWFPAAVEPDSEPDYALRILWTINIACRTPDRDEAMKYAWDAGQLIFDAHVVLKGKRSALHAAFRAGQEHAARARVRDAELVEGWQKEINKRPSWKTQATVMASIGERVGIERDSVRKRLRRAEQRRRARALKK